MAEGYRGVVGAVPYALRTSESWLFRSYAAVSALVAGTISLLFVAGVVRLIGATAAVEGGALTLSRAFFVVVGLFVVVPVLAPTLLVARRHRRGSGGDRRRDRRYDAGLALAGYVFLCTLYVGLLVASPAAFETVPDGPLGPVVGGLYALPRVVGAVAPLVGAATIVAAHRSLR